MKPSKQKRLTTDLYCLFIATAFLKMYMDDSGAEDTELLSLYKTLNKKSLEYSKYIKPLTIKANDVFNECEEELKEQMKKQSRFSKKITLNQDGEIEAHGLVFVASIIMEQEQLEDRILNLPYSVARKILNHFAESKDELVLNSMILSGYFIRKITKNN